MTARVRWKYFLPLVVLAVLAGWLAGRTQRLPDQATMAGAVQDSVPTGGFSGKRPDGADGKDRLSAPPEPRFDAAEVSKELQRLMKRMQGVSDSDAMGGMRELAKMYRLIDKLYPDQIAELNKSLPATGSASGLLQVIGLIVGGDRKTDDQFQSELLKSAVPGSEWLTFRLWAAKRPAAAVEFWKSAAALPEPPDWIKSTTSVLFGQISESDPRLALAEALTISDQSLKKSALAGIHLASVFAGPKSQWTPDSGALVENLIAASPADQGRYLLEALAGRASQESPQESMAWIDSLNLGPDSQVWTDKILAESWGRKEPAAAADWLLNRVPEADRAREVHSIVQRWTLSNLGTDERLRQPEPDIAACADWLLARGIGQETEAGMYQLSDAWVASGEPAAALEWAKAIPGGENRKMAINNVTRQIRLRYPDTWQAMLTQSGLPLPESDRK